MKIALRILIGVLIAVAVVVAIVPLLVLLDLGGGGSGWGLCDSTIGSIEGCRNSYFAGPELVAWLAIVLFGVLTLIALCVRLLRIVDRRSRPAVRPAAVVTGVSDRPPAGSQAEDASRR